jgi:hypothetical protein
MSVPMLAGERPQGGDPCLTGISRVRWSAGGYLLPIPPLAAVWGTGSPPGTPCVAFCGPLLPGWTRGPQARPVPIWHFEPVGVGGRGHESVPQPSSNVGSHSQEGHPQMWGFGGPGQQATRPEAGSQGGTGEQADVCLGAAQGWGHLTSPQPFACSQWKDGVQPSLYRWGNLGPQPKSLQHIWAPPLPRFGDFPDPFPIPSSLGSETSRLLGQVAHHHSAGYGGSGSRQRTASHLAAGPVVHW